MDGEDLRKELEQLRRRVDELDRTEPVSKPNAQLDALRRLADGPQLHDLSERVAELLKGIASDVKKAPTRALVTAFLAGFAAGRLSR